MPTMDFRNSTALSDLRLRALFEAAMAGWRLGHVTVRVRYSRGADFSGTCIYTSRKILINLGKHLRYPYMMGTHIARAHGTKGRWFKPVYRIEMLDAYHVVFFIFLHEIYHLLVKRAKRNTRQKESMCDRFATRYLVDRFGLRVFDDRNAPAERFAWDFQDVEGFVGEAQDRRTVRTAALRPRKSTPQVKERQLMLFPVE